MMTMTEYSTNRPWSYIIWLVEYAGCGLRFNGRHDTDDDDDDDNYESKIQMTCRTDDGWSSIH